MALTQGARRKIQNFVQSAKALLIREFASQLQQHYGIRPDGSYVMVEELTTHDAAIMQTARLLRERLNYLEGTIAGENKAEEAVEQLVREQAFTILNRFAALRMAEERKIIPEAIRNGYQSEGFQVFDQLTGGAKTAEVFERYTWFLKANFDELAIDLPAVFDRFSPYALLFPSEKVLLELLKIIDDEDLSIYREEGLQPMNLWDEDETIGWVYQYYNSRDEISAMREASSAPRNSRELAVRNQFFTPRYVVQFLVDNSLGRQWFEMTLGQTKLVDSCQYMVKRENEIFLAKGETVPEAKIEGANYIEYRALKDPRAILMLDPACGSMHFGLYCFDLYEQIYIEAWDNHPELMPDLRDKYLREDFLKQIPRLILEYNIHGVDIDPRAIQIAGLSLWLRVQKSYNELGLLPADRPNITKSNLVVAEPMPGNVDILSDFTKSLPGPIGKLVRVIWEKMQLAGELGLLLKIEEELKKEIEIARKEYEVYKNSSVQTTIFDAPKDSKAAEMAAIYGKEQKITKDFFDTAEEEVIKALKNFAENAQGENVFQKLLFAEDTARGFAFIEISRKRYDVGLTNPPFGLGVKNNFEWLKSAYPNSFNDLLACFVDRLAEMVEGTIAAITSRNILLTPRLQKIREKLLIPKMDLLLDLGWPVMDEATVQSAAYVINSQSKMRKLISIDRKGVLNKDAGLIQIIKTLNDSPVFVVDKKVFYDCPRGKILYNLPNKMLHIFSNEKKFSVIIGDCKQGMKTFDDNRFVRLWMEVNSQKIGKNNKFRSFSKGGEYSMYYTDLPIVLNYDNEGAEVQEVNRSKNGQTAQARQASSYYYQKGGNFSRRCKNLGVRILPQDFVIGEKGPGIFLSDKSSELYLLGIIGALNSRFYKSIVNLQANANQYDTGIIESLPFSSELTDKFEEIGKDVETMIMELKRMYGFYEESTIFKTILIDRDFKKSVIGINQNIKNLNKILDDKHSNVDILMQNTLELDFDILLAEINDSEDINQKQNIEKYRPFGLMHNKEYAYRVISYFVGVIFGRWEIHKQFGEINIDESNIFENHAGKSVNINTNSIQFIVDDKSKSANQLSKQISELVIKALSETSLQDIEIALDCDIETYLNDHNKFFEQHLKTYTISRRNAPIYWPISTISNSYIVWIYYPLLNENTLYKIINELVDPKIKEIAEEVEILEFNGSPKDYNDQKEFLGELQNFKDELLRVAQLPYKPNQDDGVLITAAPLHNLFAHSKWRKSTEACWKKLEKGEYDWAHLAYSIWPDRVTKKCKKDLSMAIAHGLESICEVKPKEIKKKEKKGVKIDKQGKLI